MNEYDKQAIEFLSSVPADMEIRYAGTAVNHLWNEKEPRDMFSFIIKTEKGSMNGIFWDSLGNTKERLARRAKPKNPRAYSILACLEKYEVGSMDDFMAEFGYEIRSAKDMTNFIETYNAVVKEYNDLCRIFTPKQMEALREIY